jgi:hypothetical protein
LEVIVMRHLHRTRSLGRVGAAAVFLVTATALLAAGCTGAARGPGSAPVASLSGHGGGTTPAQPLTQQQGDQNMINFARCMRGHGVQMSDPFHRPGHAGLSIDMPSRGPATNAAYAACIRFIQANIEAKQAAAAAEAAPHLAALTRYAQCTRSHDINMLDPTPQGSLNLGHVPGITSDYGRYSPQFRAADAACRHFLPAGVRDDGTGP